MKKKVYSKAELEQKALKEFENHPKADQLFATTDGNVFLLKNRATLHADGGMVLSVDRPMPPVQEPEPQKEKAIPVAEAIAQIKTASFEELAAFANDERKTVKKAYADRLEELGLKKEEENPTEKDSDNPEEDSDKTNQ